MGQPLAEPSRRRDTRLAQAGGDQAGACRQDSHGELNTSGWAVGGVAERTKQAAADHQAKPARVRRPFAEALHQSADRGRPGPGWRPAQLQKGGGERPGPSRRPV